MLKILQNSQMIFISDPAIDVEVSEKLMTVHMACEDLLAVSPTPRSPLPDPVLFPLARKYAAIATISYLMALLESRQLRGNVRLLDCLPSFPMHLIPVDPPFVLVANPRGLLQIALPDSFEGRLKTYLYNFSVGALITADVSTVGFNETVSPIAGLDLEQSGVHIEHSMAYALYAEAFMWSVTLWRR